jgi:hypothetical protein
MGVEAEASAADARAEDATATASRQEAADAGGFAAATRRACRVMALRGTATATSRVSPRSEARALDASVRELLARGDLVPEGGLIELGEDTELTVQATVSTREITIVGPALADACPGGDEAVRLSYGKVTAFPGAGVRPGADVWVATPLGVVRFSDAKMNIVLPDADAARVEIAVTTGQAMFVPAAGVFAAPTGERDIAASALAEGEVIPLAAGVAFAARRRGGSIVRWVADQVAACARQANAARVAAQRLASPGDAGRASLGDLAFAHVTARQRARAACEAAWAGEALAPGQLQAAQRADLEGAEATWKGAPAMSPLP